MVDTTEVLPTQLTQEISRASDISKKIWKFLIEVATDNSNCTHIEKARQLLKEISQTL
jgi:hypothetical protein